jgi:putative addiction module component (TIGR02574 family)
MAPTLESLGIDKLSAGDRMAIAHAIWDSITPETEATPLTESEKAEVDRRLAAHRADPTAAIPWDQIEAEALARLQK